jgi:hypothetical protein
VVRKIKDGMDSSAAAAATAPIVVSMGAATAANVTTTISPAGNATSNTVPPTD